MHVREAAWCGNVGQVCPNVVPACHPQDAGNAPFARFPCVQGTEAEETEAEETEKEDKEAQETEEEE